MEPHEFIADQTRKYHRRVIEDGESWRCVFTTTSTFLNACRVGHEKDVEKAVAAGLPVPENVLQWYEGGRYRHEDPKVRRLAWLAQKVAEIEVGSDV